MEASCSFEQRFKYTVTMEVFSKSPLLARDVREMVCGPVLVDRVELRLVRHSTGAEAGVRHSVCRHRPSTPPDEYQRFKMLDLEG